MKKAFTLTVLFLGAFFLLFPPSLKAQQPTPLEILQTDINAKKPILEVNIPGLDFSDVTTSADNTGTYVYISWIPQLILAIYKFGIAVVSIVAVVMIIMQGIKIASGGFISKTIKEGGKDVVLSAYKNIGRIVVGLMIAWGSYAILYNINPNLVQFNALRVQVVEGIPLTDRESSEDAGGGDGPEAAVHGKGDTGAADLLPCPNLTPGTKFQGAFTTYYSVKYGNTSGYNGIYKGSNSSLQGKGDFFCAVAMECGCPEKTGKARNDKNCINSRGRSWNPCNYFGPEAKFCSSNKYIPGGTVAASTCFPKGCTIQVGNRFVKVADRGAGIIGTHFDLYVGTWGGDDYLKDTSWLTTDLEIISCPAPLTAEQRKYMQGKYNAYKPGVCNPGVNC